jgi:AAA+ superfamily predicted ATPase
MNRLETNLPGNLFQSILGENPAAIPLCVESTLREQLPDQAFVSTSELELAEYVRLGLATESICEHPFPSSSVSWGGPDHDALSTHYEQCLSRVQWQEHQMHVLRVGWSTDCGTQSRFWILADDERIARDFVLDVARKTNDPGQTVLVFQNGYWNRSSEMFRTIQSTSMDDLILPGAKRAEMIADFQRFLKAQSQYDALGLAWRRGAILLGPPGNGKTHFLRALVHELDVPCLYVQSLSHPYYESEQLLEKVFERARQVRPCVLIFEDLDSLIDDDNRSFFLNQLDGFEKNVGLMVVATTNHAERIDPAILDRPSRFDRKYEFTVPALHERSRFLELWKSKLAETVAWDGRCIPEIAAATEGFSFAYMKELIVSALLQWMHRELDQSGRPSDRFDKALREQVELLQSQRITGFGDFGTSNYGPNQRGTIARIARRLGW